MGLFGSRTVTVPCTVEIEQTPESLHAHVTLDAGFDIEPGDAVQVHDAPADIPYGERLTVRRTATVTRAGRLETRSKCTTPPTPFPTASGSWCAGPPPSPAPVRWSGPGPSSSPISS